MAYFFFTVSRMLIYYRSVTEVNLKTLPIGPLLQGRFSRKPLTVVLCDAPLSLSGQIESLSSFPQTLSTNP